MRLPRDGPAASFRTKRHRKYAGSDGCASRYDPTVPHARTSLRAPEKHEESAAPHLFLFLSFVSLLRYFPHVGAPGRQTSHAARRDVRV